MEKNARKKKLIIIVVALIVFVASIVISFGYFVPNTIINGAINNITGTVNYTPADITITDLNPNVSIVNGYPMTQEDAEDTLTPYSFTITNNSLTRYAKVEIMLETKSSSNTMPDRLIDAKIDGVAGTLTDTNIFTSVNASQSGYQSAYKVWSGVLAPGSKSFSLLLWIDEKGDNAGGANDVQNKSWYGKIVVKAEDIENVVAINTIEDLVDLSKAVNQGQTYSGKYALLTKDLDFEDTSDYENSSRTDYGDVNGDGSTASLITELTTSTGWMPIGNSETNSFQGTFDGNGHRIDNILIEREVTMQALFGYIKNATIKNVTIDGSATNSTTNGYSYAGLVGWSYGTSYINNCTNEVDVTSNSSNGYIGGILAINGGTLTISNCVNKGNISEGLSAGGIIGYTNGTLTIINSHNTGTITQEKGNYAGGILGRDNVSTNVTTIVNSHNDGMVTSANTKANGTTYTAGIMGYLFGQVVIENSYNNSDIIGGHYSSKYIGGLIGLLDGRSTSFINNSYNKGNILSSEGVNDAEHTFAGGMIGGTTTVVGSTVNITINNSYNVGKVQAGKAYNITFAGGLIGYTQQSTGTFKIGNSYNSGQITDSSGNTGSEYLGGLIGTLQKSVVIDNSYNIGELIANNSSVSLNKYIFIGGFIGCASHNYNLKLMNSYNAGNLSTVNLSASNYVGGLVGSAHTNMQASIYNSYNLGRITNPNTGTNSFTSGLVGRLLASADNPNTKLNIYNSYNYGSVNSSNGYGIVKAVDYIIDNNLNAYTFDKVYYIDSVTNGSNVGNSSLTKTTASTFASSAFATQLNSNLNTIDKSGVQTGYTLLSWKSDNGFYPVLNN